jgi:NADH-quinone oxidoreductase subunit H
LGLVNTFFCDPIKALFKEDFVPSGVSRFVHALGPFFAVTPVFVAFALIPVAPDFVIFGESIRMQIAPLSAGVLFVVACSALAVYGAVLGAWCGNNKYSLFGGLRAAAQMISYELALGLVLVAVVLSYGSLDLHQMVVAQSQHWGVWRQPLAALLLFVVGMAETKRCPFDLPEAESEIVAGYFTEYSGMKFLLYWMSEFAEIVLLSLLLTLLFFGGWYLPFVSLPEATWLGALFGHTVLMGKVVFFCVLQIVIRWTLPRFRFDQLMTLGWKILLPLSFANLVATVVVKSLAH